MESPANTAYKSAQRKFYTWASKWYHSNTSEEHISADIPDLATILQSLGFRVRWLDLNDPKDIFPIDGFTNNDVNQSAGTIDTSGTGGTRVMLMCPRSGLRAVLEAPLAGVCRCPTMKQVESSGFWEVTGIAPTSGTQPTPSQSGSTLLPCAPKGLYEVIHDTINRLIIMVNEASDSAVSISPRRLSLSRLSLGTVHRTPIQRTTSECKTPLNVTTTMETSESGAELPVVEDCAAIKEETILLQTLTTPDTPTRYRSLDTLTADNHSNKTNGIPEPGALKAISSETSFIAENMRSSSPVLSILDNNRTPSKTSSPFHKTGHISAAICKLKEALNLLQLNGNSRDFMGSDISDIHESADGRKIPTINIRQARVKSYGSSPNLTTTNVRGSNRNLLPRQISRPVAPSSAESISKRRNSIKKPVLNVETAASTTKIKATDRSIGSNRLETSNNTGFKRKSNSSLYANVKSTIPKFQQKEKK